MEQTLNLNQNMADCIRSVSNFGGTTVMNICNGKTMVVPWGSLDWVACLFVIAFILCVLAMLGGFVRSLLSEF